MIKTVPVFCGRDCGGSACPLLATVEDGIVTRVVNNPAGGKYIKGCQRGFNLPLWEYAPDRLLSPLVRTGPRGSGQFREASWEEALNLTAQRLGEIRSQYGDHAILQLSSAGSVGALHSTHALLARFMNLFGGGTALSGNYSNGAALFVLPYLLGEDWRRSGFDAAAIQYAQMIILWGANVVETRMGAEVTRRLVEARKRGAQIVVIDPRRSATVEQLASWWIPCRPGTDSALMLAVLHVWITENRVDRPFVESHSVGFEQLEAYILGQDGSPPCSPEWAAQICGVPAEEIRRFASAYAKAKPAMLFPGYAIQRVFAGEDPYRLTVTLQVASGNFGRPGGSTGSLNNRQPGIKIGSLPVPPVPGQPEVPVLRWPDLVLKGRAGGYPSDIHAIYNLGANPINQGGQTLKSIAAFEKVDFSVTHELFLTPTARYCDVVFPAAGPLEKEDIATPWMGNFALYKPRVVPPRGQARDDYEILCDLAGRLGFLAEFSEGKSAAEWVQSFLDQSEIVDQETFRRTGIYLGPELERAGLEDFAADPAGHPLHTPSGKVEIASQQYHRNTGFPAIPIWQQPPHDPAYPLQLVTPKSAQYIHSQGSNIAAIREKAPHVLTIHPEDARVRGIQEGSPVIIFNENGSVYREAHISDEMMPGVVCLPEGIWVELDEQKADRAGSANMLTSTQGTAPAQACIMHAVSVEVKPA